MCSRLYSSLGVSTDPGEIIDRAYQSDLVVIMSFVVYEFTCGSSVDKKTRTTTCALTRAHPAVNSYLLGCAVD